MQRRKQHAPDAAAEQSLFRERFWADHDLLRDRCIVPGTPVAKLLLLGLLTKIGRNLTHWDSRIDDLRILCNGASRSTVSTAMRELRLAGLADFEALRRDERGWYRCHVARANLPDFDATTARDSGDEPTQISDQAIRKTAMHNPESGLPDPDSGLQPSAFRIGTTYPQQDQQPSPATEPTTITPTDAGKSIDAVAGDGVIWGERLHPDDLANIEKLVCLFAVAVEQGILDRDPLSLPEFLAWAHCCRTATGATNTLALFTAGLRDGWTDRNGNGWRDKLRPEDHQWAQAQLRRRLDPATTATLRIAIDAAARRSPHARQRIIGALPVGSMLASALGGTSATAPDRARGPVAARDAIAALNAAVKSGDLPR